MSFQLTILGSNSAIPCHGRHPSAQVLKTEDELFLIDCGEGTQIRLSDFQIKKFKISRILISHLHGDHVYGLPGLLTTMNLLRREAPIQIIGPSGLKSYVHNALSHTGVELTYPVEFLEIDCKGRELLVETSDLKIYGLSLDHRIATNGYLFEEKPRPLHLDGKKADELKIPFEWRQRLKMGKDYVDDAGKVLIDAQSITLPADPASSFAYLSDTRFLPELAEFIRGVTCIYHEATFLHDLVELAEDRYHSTAQQAAQLALLAEVQRLLIGHLSSRYTSFEPLLAEARTFFSESYAAEEGMIFEI